MRMNSHPLQWHATLFTPAIYSAVAAAHTPRVHSTVAATRDHPPPSPSPPQWQQDVFRRTRGRNRASLVAVDKAGTAVLMLRYVAPIPSPPSLAVRPESGAAAPRRLAWFVSHVPFVEDDNLEADREDIWMTAADFVRLGAGDQEEHACLLAGYFLNMGQARCEWGVDADGQECGPVDTSRLYPSFTPLPSQPLCSHRISLFHPCLSPPSHRISFTHSCPISLIDPPPPPPPPIVILTSSTYIPPPPSPTPGGLCGVRHLHCLQQRLLRPHHGQGTRRGAVGAAAGAEDHPHGHRRQRHHGRVMRHGHGRCVPMHCPIPPHASSLIRPLWHYGHHCSLP